MDMPVMRTVPVTSRTCEGDTDPIPTLPLVTINFPCGVTVPTPTLPVVKVLIVPVNVLVAVPLCVYPPDVAIPVVAVMAPAVFTVNAFCPTAKGAEGTQVPIPTLPFITVNAEVVVSVVPIPTLPLPVS